MLPAIFSDITKFFLVTLCARKNRNRSICQGLKAGCKSAIVGPTPTGASHGIVTADCVSAVTVKMGWIGAQTAYRTRLRIEQQEPTI